jgi:type IV pilus assembly protein PilQ
MKKNTLAKLCISIFTVLLLFGCATTSGTKEASSAEEIPVITDIAIDDGNVVIKSNKNFSYTIYNAGDPYKTTVEIPDMTTGKFTGKIVSDKPGISEIMPRQIDSPNIAARIDIILQSPSTLSPSYKDNTLVLSIRKEQPVVLSDPSDAQPEYVESRTNAVPVLAAAENPAKVVRAAEENVQPMAKATEIKGVEVNKTADAVKVIITGNGTMIPNVFPVSERIVVDIPGVSLNAKLPESGIAPLKGIRAGKHKDKLRLVLDLKEKTNFDVTAAENYIEISLQAREMQVTQAAEPKAAQTPSETSGATVAPSPVASAKPVQPAPEPEKLIEGEFTGKKISLDFQDADIIPIFRLLGDISGYNMVVNPAVKGNITLKLINVPWDQALDIILRTFSLAMVVEGNIIRIVPNTVVAKEMDEIAKAKKARDEAGELKTKIFPVNYSDLAKLKAAIDQSKVLSSRGSVTLDERGSSLIVNDLDNNLAAIETLIKELDREQMQARQVMISAKIVEVNSNYTQDLGIQWGAFWKNPTSTGDHNFTVGANSGGASAGGTGFSGNPFLVNLPAVVGEGSGGALGFGYINKAATFALDLQLSAMESTNNGKILSSPKVMTMNNQEAKITQGSTIYLPVATSDKTDYKAIDALLSLKVKPRIAPGGAIFMDLDITKDEPGSVTAGGVEVLKNTVTTSVLVNNSDTVVIGGIFKQSRTDTNNAVPGLAKLPLVGMLFQKNSDTEINTEVLIFITPTIIEYNSMK